MWRLGKREIIYVSLHCHHQNDFCIKTGSDKSHFNVSFIVRDKVTTRQSPQTTIFEEKSESQRIRTEVRLLTSLTLYHTARPNRLTVSAPSRFTAGYVQLSIPVYKSGQHQQL